MSIEKVKEYLSKWGLDDKVLEFDVSSATVQLAAEALGTEPGRIAKSLTFSDGEKTIMVIAAGDARIDNAKYKAQFGCKAKMLSYDEVEERVGHKVGGVCPFAVKDGVEVYLDVSLKSYKTVYPACGTSSSAIELTMEQLEQTSRAKSWVDVCKLPSVQQ